MYTRLYIYHDIEAFNDFDLIHALDIVPEERRLKAQQYRYTIDRKLSVIAWLMLKAATSPMAIDTTMHYGKNGKPMISAIEFNLSHCKHGVACAVSDQPIGVDIESYTYSSDVVQAVFNSHEQLLVLDDPKKFTQLWTIKESLLKYTGQGLTDNLPCLLNNANNVKFATFHSTKGYACTVCNATEGAIVNAPIIITKQQLFNGLR